MSVIEDSDVEVALETNDVDVGILLSLTSPPYGPQIKRLLESNVDGKSQYEEEREKEKEEGNSREETEKEEAEQLRMIAVDYDEYANLNDIDNEDANDDHHNTNETNGVNDNNNSTETLNNLNEISNSNNNSNQINNFFPSQPRRQLRPRTLKQLKPYLVDRYEHEAQLRGDAKRAQMIERAAAEQNLDLLEKLRQEDIHVRRRRMMEAIRKEGSEYNSDKSKRHKHINNRILESDSDSNSEVSQQSQTNILRDIMSSSSSSIADSADSDSEYEDLQHRLSKSRVLPRSYIRYLQKQQKPVMKKAKKVQSPVHRKGLAVRKMGLYAPDSNSNVDDTVDNQGNDEDRNTEFERASGRFDGMISLFESDISALKNGYSDNTNQLDNEDQLIYTNEERATEGTLSNTEGTFDNNVGSVQQYDEPPSEDFDYGPQSGESTIPEYVYSQSSDDEPSTADPFTLFQSSDSNHVQSIDLDESIEDHTSGLDRMLLKPHRSYKQRVPHKPHSLQKSRSLHKSRSLVRPQRSSSHSLRKSHSLQKSVSRPLSSSSKTSDSHTRGSKSTRAYQRSRIPHFTRLSRHPLKEVSNAGISNSVTNTDINDPKTPEVTIGNEEEKRKKRKVYPYVKDTRRYELNRAPKVTTLQIEEEVPTFYTRVTAGSVPSHSSSHQRLQSIADMFADISMHGKIYPLNKSDLTPSALCFSNWLNLTSFSFNSRTFLCSSVPKRSSTDIDNDCVLTFNDCLDFFKSEDGDVDHLVHELKVLTEKIACIQSQVALQVSNKIEIFMENALGMVSHSHTKLCFPILFFPLFQLSLLSEIAQFQSISAAYKRCLEKYLHVLFELWEPRELYNSFFINNTQWSLMFDVLKILCQITNTMGQKFVNIAQDQLRRWYKTKNLKSYLDYALIIELIESSKDDASRWRSVEFAIKKLLESNEGSISDSRFYRHEKYLFKIVRRLIDEFGFKEDEVLFKSLVKLLRKNNFMNFEREQISFKLFDRLENEEFRHSDSICNSFIKLVMRCYKQSETSINFSRLVQFFEPNFNIFSDPTKPDVFLQTLVNKLNIYIMITQLSQADYTRSIIGLVKNVNIQNDLDCYDRTFDALVVYYNIRKSKNDFSKSHASAVFEDMVGSIINTSQSAVEDQGRYLELFKKIVTKITEFSTQTMNLQSSVELYVKSLNFSKLVVMIKERKEPEKFLQLLLSSLNQFCKSLKAKVPNLNNLIKEDYFSQLVNSLLHLLDNTSRNTDLEDLFIELIQCLGSLGDTQVKLKLENWQSLSFNWRLFNLQQYDLVWLSQVLKYNGANSMKYDSEIFIEPFAKTLVRYEAPKGIIEFYRYLKTASISLHNPWISCDLLNTPESLTTRLKLLSHFLKHAETYDRNSLKYLNSMINEYKKEFEHRATLFSSVQKQNQQYLRFSKKVVTALCSPSLRNLLKQTKEYYFIMKLTTTELVSFGSNFEEKYIHLLREPNSENEIENEVAVIEFLQEQVFKALKEKNSVPVKDLFECFTNLYKDSALDVAQSSYKSSNIYHLVLCISSQFKLFQKFKHRIWLPLCYSTTILDSLIDQIPCLVTNDIWLLLHFLTQINSLNVWISSKKDDLRYLVFKIGFFFHFYSIFNKLAILLEGSPDFALLVTLFSTKSRLLNSLYMKSQYTIDTSTSIFQFAEIHTLEVTVPIKQLVSQSHVDALSPLISKRLKSAEKSNSLDPTEEKKTLAKYKEKLNNEHKKLIEIVSRASR